MSRAILPRLQDIDGNIGIALDLVHGRTLRDLNDDIALRYALQFSLLIIAEAVRGLPDELLAGHPSIPWRSIRALGNHLRHEYHRIDHLILWQVATQHLSPLRLAVRKMLAGVAAPIPVQPE